jgi:cysteine desulfurase
MAVYLDYNATTPVDERVLAAMLPYLSTHYANPSSLHRQGRMVRAAVEAAREQVAALVNTHPSQIVFTSGGTEANNLALKGACAAAAPGRLIVSAVEHSSVLEPARSLVKTGWVVDEVPVDEDGRVAVEAVRGAMTEDTRLVSVMMANNETGAIQDSAAIAAVVAGAGAVFHTDAVQALGKMAVDFPASGARLMSLSAHKIYGPKGVGALVYDRSLPMEPQLHGSGHEGGLRSGTENVAGIIGFGAAAELAQAQWRVQVAALRGLRDYLERRLHELPEVVIFCERAERLANTVFMALQGIEGEALKMGLDRAGIAVSSGSACTAGSSEPSHVLTAMGVPEHLARCAVRISLGHGNTRHDVDVLIDALKCERRALDDTSLLAWK